MWWTFKGEDENFAFNLTTNDGVVITRTSQKMSVLGIDAVKARHRGNYTCYAQNKAGFSQQSAYLSINGHFNLESLKSSEFCNLFPKNLFL
jgi:hypothetical protein